MPSDQLIKVGVLLLYLGALLGIGALASRRMKDLTDYFAAGKKLSFWAAAFSARATGESAWLLLGLTGMGFAFGMKAFWVVLGEVLGVAVSWGLMCRRFKALTDRYESVTIPDYLESRFRDGSHLLRVIAATALTLFVTIYVSAQIDATGKAFEDFLGWNYFVGLLVGFVVVLIYVVSGGFLAVVWSDVFQGTLMVLGLVLLPIVGLVEVGGWSGMTASLQAQDPSLLSLAGSQGWTPIAIAEILSFALIGLGFLGSPQIFVRFLALKSTREVKPGGLVAFLWTVLADSGAVLTGMLGRALLLDLPANFDRENILPVLVEHVFPAVIVGFYIAVVLSAIMSTIDSLLVVAGSAAVRDFYQKVFHPEMSDDQLVATSRLATLGISVAALGIALVVSLVSPNRTVFWFVIFGWSGIAATFCPVMILSLFWKGVTRRGAAASMVVGFLCIPLFKFAMPLVPGLGAFFTALTELPPAFLLAGVAGVVVSLTDRAGQLALIEAGLEEELAQASGHGELQGRG